LLAALSVQRADALTESVPRFFAFAAQQIRNVPLAYSAEVAYFRLSHAGVEEVFDD
jgi:hypothetical protein